MKPAPLSAYAIDHSARFREQAYLCRPLKVNGTEIGVEIGVAQALNYKAIAKALKNYHQDIQCRISDGIDVNRSFERFLIKNKYRNHEADIFNDRQQNLFVAATTVHYKNKKIGTLKKINDPCNVYGMNDADVNKVLYTSKKTPSEHDNTLGMMYDFSTRYKRIKAFHYLHKRPKNNPQLRADLNNLNKKKNKDHSLITPALKKTENRSASALQQNTLLLRPTVTLFEEGMKIKLPVTRKIKGMGLVRKENKTVKKDLSDNTIFVTENFQDKNPVQKRISEIKQAIEPPGKTNKAWKHQSHTPSDDIRTTITNAFYIAATEYTQKNNIPVIYLDSKTGLLTTRPVNDQHIIRCSATYRNVLDAFNNVQLASHMSTGNALLSQEFADNFVADINNKICKKNWHLD